MTPLETLNTTLRTAVDHVGAVLTDLGNAGENLRGGVATTLEAAIAGAAAAACAVRIEAALALAPRLPYATAQSVCADVEHAADEAYGLLPYAVAAGVFGADLRAAPLLVALLADRPQIDVQHLQDVALSLNQVGSLLQNTTASGMLGLGQSARVVIDVAMTGSFGAAQSLNEIAVQAVSQSVNRVFTAAQRGAGSVRSAALQLTAQLREGSAARRFAGRSTRAVSLDRSIPQVVAQGFAVLAKPDYRELYRIIAVTEASRAEFAISGKSSFLTLAGQNLDLFANAVRETTVFAQSEELQRGLAPLTTPVQGATLDVNGDMSALPTGRTLLIKGLRVDNGEALVHAATLQSVLRVGSNTRLGIAPPLPQALQRDSVVVFGNVALATHGETASQILGAGDASQSFQRFELKRLPLTYRSAANEIGADSELTVRVGDVEWAERPTLFGSTPAERAYALSTDEQGKLFVVFGDGQRGARLPSGANNVRARYRQGLGNAGNVSAEKLTQLVTRPPGLKSVVNPVAASGGTDAEPVDQARRTMPLGTRTLGRAVSLLDYEDFAMAFTGIAKAQARVLQLASGVVVAVTIAGQDGRPLAATNPVRANLLAALKSNGDPHVDVVLLDYQPLSFRLALKVKREPDYAIEPVLANVDAALRRRFGFDARALAQPVQESDVIATVHSVPGVLAVDLDALYLGATPSAQTRLLAAQMRLSGGVPRAAELLTLASGPLDRLEEFS